MSAVRARFLTFFRLSSSSDFDVPSVELVVVIALRAERRNPTPALAVALP
jgi:hypothetical protein